VNACRLLGAYARLLSLGGQMAKKNKEFDKREFLEVARAERSGKAVRKYNGKIVYSLSASGKIYQAMIFHKEGYAAGTSWHYKDGGDPELFSAEIMRVHWESEGFEVKVWTNPHRINYELQAKEA
jgi:hypothetical protein